MSIFRYARWAEKILLIGAARQRIFRVAMGLLMAWLLLRIRARVTSPKAVWIKRPAARVGNQIQVEDGNVALGTSTSLHRLRNTAPRTGNFSGKFSSLCQRTTRTPAESALGVVSVRFSSKMEQGKIIGGT